MGQQAVRAEAAAGVESAGRSLAAVKIRAFRKRARLSAQDLGAQLGVSGPAVRYWERGLKKPRTDMQGDLARRGICEPNDWHLPAPGNDQGAVASAGESAGA